MSERRCEHCTHFVKCPTSKEFDICLIEDCGYEIYRDLLYNECSGYSPIDKKQGGKEKMNIYEGITAADMLEYLRGFIVTAMRNGDVCEAARGAEEMNRIENISGHIAEKRGINK